MSEHVYSSCTYSGKFECQCGEIIPFKYAFQGETKRVELDCPRCERVICFKVSAYDIEFMGSLPKQTRRGADTGGKR